MVIIIVQEQQLVGWIGMWSECNAQLTACQWLPHLLYSIGTLANSSVTTATSDNNNNRKGVCQTRSVGVFCQRIKGPFPCHPFSFKHFICELDNKYLVSTCLLDSSENHTTSDDHTFDPFPERYVR